MSRLKSLFNTKKKIALVIGLVLLVIGIIPLLIFTFWADPSHPYTITQIELTSADSTRLSALLYVPNNKTQKMPGVVVAHGFCGCKQFMNELSIELVKRQFVVVSIDFRGHGSSEGYLPAQHRQNNEELMNDVMAAVYYLRNLSFVNNEIGLVGHSMGGRTVTSLSALYPNEFNATVSIGMIPSSETINITNIKNLLIAFGQYEQIFTKSMGLEFLKNYTKLSTVDEGILYGSFSAGNATKLVIGPGTEHLFEVQNPTIISETVNWLENAFYGTIRWPINLTCSYHFSFFILTIFAVVLIDFTLIAYIFQYLWKNRPVYTRKKSETTGTILKLVLGYVLCNLFGLILGLFLSSIFTDVLPVSLGNVLYGVLVGISTMIFIISYFLILRRRSKKLKIRDFSVEFKELMSKNWARSSIFGVIAAILVMLTITSISHWSNSPIFLTGREIGTVIGMTILFFPWILVKEFYLRNIQRRLKTKNNIIEYFQMLGIGILIENIVLFPIMCITWANPNSNIAFLALALFVFILFSIIQQILVTWVFMHSGRNITGSALFLSIIYSYMIVNFFPFGFAMSLI
ncbi:MAG: alpha/beta hydrolase [Candidatus Helarchaeota archaeon]